MRSPANFDIFRMRSFGVLGATNRMGETPLDFANSQKGSASSKGKSGKMSPSTPDDIQ